MNPVETTVVAVSVAALVMIVTVVVLFAVFHRKIDAIYNALASRVHDVEKAIEGQGDKIAVIHHVATAPAVAAPSPSAAPAGKN